MDTAVMIPRNAAGEGGEEVGFAGMNRGVRRSCDVATKSRVRKHLVF